MAKGRMAQKWGQNTSYFHSKALNHCKKNEITHLKDNVGSWKETNEEILELLENYYDELFHTILPSGKDLEITTKNLDERLSSEVWSFE